MSMAWLAKSDNASFKTILTKYCKRLAFMATKIKLYQQ